jgi:hypothetical protein
MGCIRPGTTGSMLFVLLLSTLVFVKVLMILAFSTVRIVYS